MVSTEVRSWLTVHRRESAPGHFMWPLVERDELSVRLEVVPAGGGFDTHLHRNLHQFVFVLEGVAVIDVEGETVRLSAHEGLEVAAGERHCIWNAGDGCMVFLLVTAPRVVPTLGG